MTLYQRQQCGLRFEKAVLAALKPLLKKSPWRMKSNWIFAVDGDWFIQCFVTGGLGPDGLTNKIDLASAIKPMSVDPIYWQAEGLAENLNRPPSFRCNAAFKTPALPVTQTRLGKGFEDPEKAAQLLRTALDTHADAARAHIADTPFSDLALAAGEKYAALHKAAAIAEGKSRIEDW